MPTMEMPSNQQLSQHGGSLKDMNYALGRLAYNANVDPRNQADYMNFIKNSVEAQDIMRQASSRFGNQGSSYLVKDGPALYRAAYDRFRGDDVKNQQQVATNKAFTRADEYKKNLGQTIQDETSALRGSLATQLAETRGAIKQQENASGMLYSGRRQKREGEAANLASKQFAEGAGNIVQGAEETSASLYGQAGALKSGAQSAQSQAQGIVDRAREARQSASAALQGQYSNLIGQGVGRYLGNRGASRSVQTPGGSISASGGFGSFEDISGGGF